MQHTDEYLNLTLASTIYRDGGLGRTPLVQGGYQMAALGVTLGLALVSGLITGFLMRLPIFEQIEEVDDMFNDEPSWLTPSDFPRKLNEIKIETNEEELVEDKI